MDLFYISDIVDTLNLSYFRLQMAICVWALLAQKVGEGGSEEERNSFRYEAAQVLEAMFEERREPASESGLIVPPGTRAEETFT